MSELAVLIIGCIVLAATLAIIMTWRQKDNLSNDENPGLISQNSHEPPSDLTPAMASALVSGDVSNHVIRLSLLELAAKGYLTITALVKPNGRAVDWTLLRTNKTVSDELRAYEKLLVSEPFNGRDNNPVRVNSLLADSSFTDGVVAELTRELQAKGWFSPDGLIRHSRWGLIGSLLLLVGLVVTLVMLFDWLAVRDIRGVIGGLLLGISGLLLANKGRIRSLATEEGLRIGAQTMKFRRMLDHFKADQIDFDHLNQQFATYLCWAVHFGNHEQVAKVFGQTVKATAGWGRDVRLDTSWFQPRLNSPSLTKFASAAFVFTQEPINALTNTRARKQKVQQRLAGEAA